MDELQKAIDEQEAGRDWLQLLDAPVRGHFPTIHDNGIAQIAQQIIWIADGIDSDKDLLPGLLFAYALATGGITRQQYDAVEDIRHDLATWRALNVHEPPEDLMVPYQLWDGMARHRERQGTDAHAARRLVLRAMKERGMTLRDIAERIGVQSHNAVATAIKRADKDLQDHGTDSWWARSLADRLTPPKDA